MLWDQNLPSYILFQHYFTMWDNTLREQYLNTVSLHLPGSNSAGRIYCGTDPAECVSALEISSSPRWPSHQALIHFGGLRLLPGAWGDLNKGNADGADGIFGYAVRVWAPALGQDPPKKPLCHTCPFGGACNKSCSIVIPEY